MENIPFGLRLALPQDFDRIYKIWEINQAASTGKQIQKKESDNLKKEFRGLFQNAKGFFFVAYQTDNQQVVGWQSILPLVNNPLLSENITETSVYIDPMYLGKGIGSLLFGHTCKYLKRTEVRIVIAWIKAKNVASQKMVERSGWKQFAFIDNGFFKEEAACKLYIHHVQGQETNQPFNIEKFIVRYNHQA